MNKIGNFHCIWAFYFTISVMGFGAECVTLIYDFLHKKVLTV